MYKILLTKRAIKDLEKLDNSVKEHIGSKLKILMEDPLINIKKLSNPSIGTYRIRIGDYRVIYDIEQENIVVLRIGHRKDIYK